jgi:AcrR family transcriptional regulator
MAASATPRRGPGRPPAGESTGPSSRKRLIDAAAKVFAERGYLQATVDDVAAEAGLSKGTVYWNFQSKADLFAALVEDRIDRPAEQIVEITRTATAEETSLPRVSAGVAALLVDQRDVFLLLHEYWIAAVRDPEMRRGWRRRQDRLRKSLASALEKRHETTGVPSTVPLDELATVFISLAMGLSMEALIDPGVATDKLFGEYLSLAWDGNAARTGRLPS